MPKKIVPKMYLQKDLTTNSSWSTQVDLAKHHSRIDRELGLLLFKSFRVSTSILMESITTNINPRLNLFRDFFRRLLGRYNGSEFESYLQLFSQCNQYLLELDEPHVNTMYVEDAVDDDEDDTFMEDDEDIDDYLVEVEELQQEELRRIKAERDEKEAELERLFQSMQSMVAAEREAIKRARSKLITLQQKQRIAVQAYCEGLEVWLEILSESDKSHLEDRDDLFNAWKIVTTRGTPIRGLMVSLSDMAAEGAA